MIEKTKLILFNLVGGKGAGKSTLFEAIIRLYLPARLRNLPKKELVRRYHHPPRIKIIRSPTERGRRRGEEGSWDSEGSWEREFFEHEEFERRLHNGRYGPDAIFDDQGEDPIFSKPGLELGDYPPDILPLSIKWVSDNGIQSRSGISHPRNWPEPDKDTLFYLANFADSTPTVMPWIREYFPNMKNFFISVGKEELRRRLSVRNEALGMSFEDQWAINEMYLSSHPEDGCDFIVSNDDGSTPEQVAIKIVQLAGLALPRHLIHNKRR